MTIETQQGKKSWIGDGSTTNYPYSYPFLNASDIEVYLDGEKQASGFSVQNKTDYSTGANIIFDVAPAEGVLIVIRRNVPMTQEISYPENGEFPAKSHEKSLDKLTMLIIDNNKETLKVGPATPEDFDATFPVPEANKALKITADGKGFTMSDYDPDTALALTEDFKNQAQQAAIDALSSQTAAAQQANIATQQANIATEKTAEVVESGTTAVQNIDTAFSAANEWFSKLNAIPYIPVGTILPTTGAIDESLGYQRYANGQLIANVSSQAPDLVKFLEFQEAHAPNLLCSETEWQTALTLSTLGQVGKYVWNKEDDSIRIPRIVNIQGMMDMNTVGNMVEAGLPNINGSFGFTDEGGTGDLVDYAFAPNDSLISGCFTRGSTTKKGLDASGSGTVNGADVLFDASLSNPIYGNSDTVQQESILYPYVLQIATGVQYKTPVINEIELNNPFSLLDYKYSEYELNNLSWLRSNGQYNSKAIYPAVYDLLLKIYNGTETKAGVSVKFSTETFTDYDFVLNTAEETFRLPIKVKLASGKAVVGNGMTLGLIGKEGKTAGLANNQGSNAGAMLFPLAGSYGLDAGTLVTSGNAVGYSTFGITTDPTKSGLELSDSDLYLYFYVGETVQNANLVNVGRIEEKLSTVIPDNSSLISSYGMPSGNKYIDLTLGASGTTYTAPANGYFYLNKVAGSDWYYIRMRNTISNIDLFVDGYRTSPLTSVIPAKKGEKVRIEYNATGTTNDFRFIYAEGEQ